MSDFSALTPTKWRVIFALLSTDIASSFAGDLMSPMPADTLRTTFRLVIGRHGLAYEADDAGYPTRIADMYDDLLATLSTADRSSCVMAWIHNTFAGSCRDNEVWDAYLSAFIEWSSLLRRTGNDCFNLGPGLSPVARLFECEYRERNKLLQRKIADIQNRTPTDWDMLLLSAGHLGLKQGENDLFLFTYLIGPSQLNYFRRFIQLATPYIPPNAEENMLRAAAAENTSIEMPRLSELPYPNWWQCSASQSGLDTSS